MDSSSPDSTKMSIFDQDLSDCLEREPTSPISVQTAGRKKFPKPSWGKHTFLVNIEEKPDDVQVISPNSEDIDEKEVSKSGHKITNLKQTAQQASKVLAANRMKEPKTVLVKETRNFKVSVLANDFDESDKETMEERSNRLLFESKRKSFYLDEGLTFKRYHRDQPEVIIDKSIMFSSPSTSSLSTSSSSLNIDVITTKKNQPLKRHPPMKFGTLDVRTKERIDYFNDYHRSSMCEDNTDKEAVKGKEKKYKAPKMGVKRCQELKNGKDNKTKTELPKTK